MSTVKPKTIIRQVIQETGDAFKITCENGAGEVDYAEFASAQSLPSFQQALNDPSLTYEQLCQILRRASNKAVRRQCKTPWPLFMAKYVERFTNMNGH